MRGWWIALVLCLLGCRHHRRARRARLIHHSESVGRFFVAHAEGARVHLGGDRYLEGSSRRSGIDAAGGASPATALVASAELPDRWLFAAEDGTVYQSDTFLGSLRVTGAFPVVASPRGALPRRGLHGLGGLFYVDRTGAAHAYGPVGGARRLPLARVLSGAFVTPTVLLAVTEPGMLQRSDDAGLSFRPVQLPSGTPLAVLVRDGVARVYSTDGPWRFNTDGLQRDPTAPTLESLEAAGSTPHPEEGFPLPDGEDQVVARADGAVVTLERGALVERDPRTGQVLRRSPAPGSACQLFGGGPALRLSCTDGRWARVVFVERDGGGWDLCRDERRGEEPGDLVADPRGRGWVVSAPCEPGAVHDPRALCVYDDRGARSLRVAPFDVLPVALRGSALLAVELASSGERTRAVLWRGSALQVLDLPFPHEVARALRWTRGGWSTWERTPRGGLQWILGRETEGAVRWSRRDAPPGARYGAHLDDGGAVALGRSAAELWRFDRARGFVPLRGLVDGAPTWLSLEDSAGAYCAGSVCRLSPRVTWSAAGSGSAPTLARTDPPWVGRARPRAPLLPLRCALEAYAPAPPPAPAVPPLASQRALRALGSASPSARVYQVPPGRLLALDVTARAGVSVARTAAVDGATGAVLARATMALWAPPEAVGAGSVDAREGVFVQGDDGWLRFHPVTGPPLFPSTWPALGASTPWCASDARPRGVAYLAHGTHTTTGPGWAESDCTHTTETLSLVGEGTCVSALRVALSGGAEAPRELLLERPEGAAVLGSAWRGAQRARLRCEPTR
ncbi:MAG: hypothetical protein HY909_20915 [Deltaproteobacteria bacterium]|nr:hypothetical protein [Deltaproteobacteria bacterium]